MPHSETTPRGLACPGDSFKHNDRHRWLGREACMLFTIAVILVILWMLGMLSSYTAGGLVHLLLVVAIIAVLVRIIQGRRVVS